jgi:hypothetical protein
MAASALVVSTPALACTTAEFKCTLQADAVPTDQPWTEPARASYTINTKGPDTFAVDVAGQGVFDLGHPFFGVAELAWHRNSQADKRQNNLQAAAGLHLELDNTPADGPIRDASRLWSLYVDGRLSYNRKAVYADPTTAACQANPSAATCHTQHVESWRATLDVSPHIPGFESARRFTLPGPGGSTPGEFEGPPIAYSFGTIATLFHDDILDNKVNPATGTAISGSVTGLKGTAGLALSPRFANYRINVRANLQLIRALSRSAGRRDDFDGFSHLFTASLEYDFGDRSLVPGRRWFRPSLGITYTDGSDPLAGRADQSTLMFGLRLSYR